MFPKKVSERLLYEDDEYLLRKYVYDIGGCRDVEYELIIRESFLGLNLDVCDCNCFDFDRESSIIAVKIWNLLDHWNRFKMVAPYDKEFRCEMEDYSKMKRQAEQISSPKEFIRLFFEVLSPSLASLIFEKVRRGERNDN